MNDGCMILTTENMHNRAVCSWLQPRQDCVASDEDVVGYQDDTGIKVAMDMPTLAKELNSPASFP